MGRVCGWKYLLIKWYWIWNDRKVLLGYLVSDGFQFIPLGQAGLNFQLYALWFWRVFGFLPVLKIGYFLPYFITFTFSFTRWKLQPHICSFKLKVCQFKVHSEETLSVPIKKLTLIKDSPLQFLSGGQSDMDELNLDYAVSIKISTVKKQPGHLILEIKLNRLLWRSFLENILPPALLVVVSWVSF